MTRRHHRPGKPDQRRRRRDLEATVFEGTTLRSMLLNAYGWWTLGTYTLFAGIGLTIAAFAVLCTFVFELSRWRVDARATSPASRARSRVRRGGLGAGGRHRPDDQARQLTPLSMERPAGRTGGPFSCPPFRLTGPLSPSDAKQGRPAPGRSEQEARSTGEGARVRQRGAASRPLRSRKRAAQRGAHATVPGSGILVAQSKEARSRARERTDVHDRAGARADAAMGGPGDAQAAGLKWRHSPAPGSSSSISTSSGSSVRQGSMRSKTISWIVQSMSMISVILA